MLPNERITTSSSSSSSSSSPFFTTRKTMDDVWKDITKTSSFRSLVLQDFLNPKPTSIPQQQQQQQHRIAPPPPPSPLAPPAPVPVIQTHLTQMGLNLNSAPEFQFLEDDMKFNAGLEVLSPSPFLASFGKKRFTEDSEGGEGGDRRHKRMVKNRESAARSRARKQAFVNELEEEVAYLREENTRLKRQQQQQYMMQEALARIQLQQPNQQQQQRRLQRTSTAPF